MEQLESKLIVTTPLLPMEERRRVKHSWDRIKDDDIGVKIFAELFRRNPLIKVHAFNFAVHEADLRTNQRFLNHVRVVENFLTTCIDEMVRQEDYTLKLDNMLSGLGAKHGRIDQANAINARNWDEFRECIVTVVLRQVAETSHQQSCSSSSTAPLTDVVVPVTDDEEDADLTEVRDAWRRFVEYLTHQMADAFYEERNGKAKRKLVRLRKFCVQSRCAVLGLSFAFALVFVIVFLTVRYISANYLSTTQHIGAPDY